MDGTELKKTTIIDHVRQESIGTLKTLLYLCGVWLIHECLLMMALICSRSYLPFTYFFWLLECIFVSLITLKWLPYHYEFWWIRHIINIAFGFAIGVIFSGDEEAATEYIYPRILRWLGRNHLGENVRIAKITDLLRMRRYSVDIGSNVTLGAHILFNDNNVKQCSTIVEDGSSLGNDCVLEAGCHIPQMTNVGSMTRIDSSPRFEQSGQVFVGIPFRQISFSASTICPNYRSDQISFPYLLIRSLFIRLMSLVFICSTFYISILPFWIIIFSFITSRLYLTMIKSYFWSTLSSTLIEDLRSYIGPFLGGTQWLNVFLNSLGAVIHPSTLIADIDCIDDPEMITIGANVCIEQYARVQVSVS